MPVAERQQETGRHGWPLRWPSRITGRIPGWCPGPAPPGAAPGILGQERGEQPGLFIAVALGGLAELGQQHVVQGRGQHQVQRRERLGPVVADQRVLVTRRSQSAVAKAAALVM
jgi:hypothetical protein